MIYRVARFLWRLALFGFFRRIAVEGGERVPARGPVLLVANHTNALVDGLLILTRLDRPVTLTAKNTLAANPLVRVTMRALGVIAFHRIRDLGAGAQPERNAAALAECRRRLGGGGGLCIFPEGISHSDAALRPFRSGAARIALEYLEHETVGDDVAADAPGVASRASREPLLILPLGLHYDRKEAFRSMAALLVGEPLDLTGWRRANPDAGARELTAEIERRVRELTANFDARRESVLFAHAAELLAAADRDPPPLGREADRVAERVRLIHRLQDGARRLRAERPAEVGALEADVARLRRELHRRGITAAELWLPLRAGHAAFFVLRELELALVGLPLALWGMLNGLLPYHAVRAAVRRMSEDRDHFASNAVFVGIPMFALFWTLQTVAVALLLPLPVALLYAASLPFAGAVALLYRDRVGSAWRRSRTFVAFLRRPAERRALLEQARAVTGEIRRLGQEIEAHV